MQALGSYESDKMLFLGLRTGLGTRLDRQRRGRWSAAICGKQHLDRREPLGCPEL
jgi:hypothetical protein